MKLLSILFISVTIACSSHHVYSAQGQQVNIVHQENNVSSMHNGLFIFLDNAECNGHNPCIYKYEWLKPLADKAIDMLDMKFGIISTSLFIALWQKVGPIVASTSLLKNIFKHPTWVKILNFDEKFWCIKKINHDLCLLLPKTFLDVRNVSLESIQHINTDSARETELKLGLLVNHMITVTDLQQELNNFGSIISQQTESINDTDTPKATHGTDIGKLLDNLFCTHQSYQNTKIQAPIWSVYLTGHGTNGYIANLHVDQFKLFLDFLENSIDTKLFFYSSCYANGMNADWVYVDQKTGEDKTYSYTIIAPGIPDHPIIMGLTSPNDFETSKELISNFIPFFEAAESNQPIDYPVLAHLLTKTNKQVSNWPQIRPAHATSFHFVDKGNQEVFSIPAGVDANNVPITIPVNTRLLTLSEHVGEINLTSDNIEAIISEQSGFAVHAIDHLTSQHHSIDEIISLFTNCLDHSSVMKLFCIKKITTNGSKLERVAEVLVLMALGVGAKFGYNVCTSKPIKNPFTQEYKNIIKAFNEPSKMHKFFMLIKSCALGYGLIKACRYVAQDDKLTNVIITSKKQLHKNYSKNDIVQIESEIKKRLQSKNDTKQWRFV